MQQQLAQVEITRSKTLKEAAMEAREIVENARKSADLIATQGHEELVREIAETHRRAKERLEQEQRALLESTKKKMTKMAAELAGKILASGDCAEKRHSFTQQAIADILQ
jgi:F0F1-type ATP synthase membrane subunit b/b'